MSFKFSFLLWIQRFEAMLRATGVKNEKWKDFLLCCTDSVAFAAVFEKILEDATTSYAELKALLKEKFAGEEYKRNLETKPRGLVWKKELNVSTSVHDLRTVIRDLYGLTDADTINTLATNHVVNTLEDSMRKEAKIFQLTNSTGLESLIEFLNTRFHGNQFRQTPSPERIAAT